MKNGFITVDGRISRHVRIVDPWVASLAEIREQPTDVGFPTTTTAHLGAPLNAKCGTTQLPPEPPALDRMLPRTYQFLRTRHKAHRGEWRRDDVLQTG